MRSPNNINNITKKKLKEFKKFGKLVAEKRIKMNKSQRQIAEMIGVKQIQISRTEVCTKTTHMSYDKIKELANVLGIDEDQYCALFDKIPKDIYILIKKAGFDVTREALYNYLENQNAEPETQKGKKR